MRIELRGRITSLDLLAMHLLLQSWITGFLVFLQVLLVQVQVLTHHYAQVFCNAAVNPSISQSVLILGIVTTLV